AASATAERRAGRAFITGVLVCVSIGILAGWPARRLEPGAQADDPAGVPRAIAGAVAQIGRTAVGTFVHQADVGREPAGELVAQAQPGLGRRQPGAYAPRSVVFREEACFHHGLQDQPVGQQQLVIDLDDRLDLARLAQVGRRLGLEHVGRQALNADGGPGLRVTRSGLLADAGDHVPPGRDRASVQHFDIGGVGTTGFALALAAQPDPVDVASQPALQLPALSVAVVAVPRFEPIDEQEPVDAGAV